MNNKIKQGDFVTRNSYNNDILFEVIKIKDNKCILHGVELRIIADSNISDLNKVKKNDLRSSFFYENISNKLKRNDFFYIPGRILHLDGDKRYLEECMNYYKKNNILAFGKSLPENNIKKEVYNYLKEVNPNILVITGHDSYSNKNKEYKNSKNFIDAVKVARKYIKSNNELVIIAGACQSDYIGLIKAGSTFASSPKGINIHALDPAIVASLVSLKENYRLMDIKEIVSQTKYKESGIGGIQSFGMMEVGYPRKGDK